MPNTVEESDITNVHVPDSVDKLILYYSATLLHFFHPPFIFIQPEL